MNPGGGGESDLERRLERELARSVRSLRGPSPSPSQAAYHRLAERTRRRHALPVFGPLAARAAALAIIQGVLAAGGAVVATGSANPTVWGSTVTRVVATCKGSLPSRRHAIGPCVSAAEQRSTQAPAGQAPPSPTPSAPTPSAAAPSVPGGVSAPSIVTVPPTAAPADPVAGQTPGRWSTTAPVDPTQRAHSAGSAAGTSHPAGKADRGPSPTPGACASLSKGPQPATSRGTDPATSHSDNGNASGCDPTLVATSPSPRAR